MIFQKAAVRGRWNVANAAAHYRRSRRDEPMWKRKRNEEWLPWYRAPDYKGNLTEAEKRQLDAFRMQEKHPAAAFEDLPEEVQYYIGLMEVELNEKKQELVTVQAFVLAAIGAAGLFLNYKAFFGPPTIWSYAGAVGLIILAWVDHRREWKKNAEEYYSQGKAPLNSTKASAKHGSCTINFPRQGSTKRTARLTINSRRCLLQASHAVWTPPRRSPPTPIDSLARDRSAIGVLGPCAINGVAVGAAWFKVASLRSLRTHRDAEPNPIAGARLGHARGLYGRNVQKHILAALVGENKTEPSVLMPALNRTTLFHAAIPAIIKARFAAARSAARCRAHGRSRPSRRARAA